MSTRAICERGGSIRGKAKLSRLRCRTAQEPCPGFRAACHQAYPENPRRSYNRGSPAHRGGWQGRQGQPRQGVLAQVDHPRQLALRAVGALALPSLPEVGHRLPARAPPRHHVDHPGLRCRRRAPELTAVDWPGKRGQLAGNVATRSKAGGLLRCDQGATKWTVPGCMTGREQHHIDHCGLQGRWRALESAAAAVAALLRGKALP